VQQPKVVADAFPAAATAAAIGTGLLSVQSNCLWEPHRGAAPAWRRACGWMGAAGNTRLLLGEEVGGFLKRTLKTQLAGQAWRSPCDACSFGWGQGCLLARDRWQVYTRTHAHTHPGSQAEEAGKQDQCTFRWLQQAGVQQIQALPVQALTYLQAQETSRLWQALSFGQGISCSSPSQKASGIRTVPYNNTSQLANRAMFKDLKP